MNCKIRSKIALISVYNKNCIVQFAKSLKNLGWTIVASNGTAKHLKKSGIHVTFMEELTKIPPILDHRVFSEHIIVAGGLVAKPTKRHDNERQKYNIPWFDLLCVDLYPINLNIDAQNLYNFFIDIIGRPFIG